MQTQVRMSMSAQQRFLESAVVALVCSAFFVPLALVSSSFIFPFIVPKVLLFRTIVLLLVGCYILLLFLDWQRYRLPTSRVMWVVTAFLASMTVSTFVGVDWYHSFWDNHERMLGLFTISHYFLFFVVIGGVFKTPRHWRIAFTWFLVAGMLVVCGALFQKVDTEFLLNQGNIDRVSSTLGNPIYLGGYGLFLCFAALIHFFLRPGITWRVASCVMMCFGVAAVILSGTRGSFIGTIIGVAMVLAWYMATRWSDMRVRIVAGAIVGVLCVGIGLMIAYRESPIIQRVPVINRLVGLRIDSGTVRTRLDAWSLAVEAWKERPLFGWGPNNFFYAFNKYYRPQALVNGWGETWFDNAHNIMVNTLTVQGMVGLMTYCGIFVLVFWEIIRGYRRGVLTVHLAACTSGFFLAHIIHNIFVFENPTSLLYFFFMLAWVVYITRGLQPESEGAKEIKPQHVSGYIVAVTSLAVLFLVYVTNVNPARANMATLQTLKRTYSGQEPLAAFEAVEQIPSPHIDDIRSDFARVVVETLPEYVKAGRTEEAWSLLQRAYLELQKNRALHPLDIRVQLQQSDIAQIAFAQFQKQDYMLDAARGLVDALEKSPKRQQVIYQLVVFELGFGRSQEAIQLLTQSIADEPRVGEGWWRLAVVYQQLGDMKMAKKVATDARAAGAAFDERGKQVIDSILAAPDATPAKSTKK